MSDNKKVVLAYSGGLDTTCILFWLKEKGYQVICYLADIGQHEDFEAIKKQALSLGAIDAVVENREREFVEEFIYPALSFGTIYQERYLLGTSLARPCITLGIVELAKKEKVNFIAHGATGKGNDQVRFELTAASIAPNIKVIAPWRLPEFYERFKGRKDLLEYAAKNGFKTPATAAKPYSVDANLMHISYESGILEKPINRPSEDMFAWTKSLEAKVEGIQSKLTKGVDPSELVSTVSNFLNEIKPTDIEIKISGGIPTKLTVNASNQTVTDSVRIIKTLNDIGAQHGVGRIDIVEDRFIGMKSRGVYETPGGTILFTAIQDLQTLCLDKEVNKIRQELAAKFACVVYSGLWFSPEGLYLKSCLTMSQKLVSGLVKLSIFAGRITVTGRSADKSLYDEDLVSMDVQGNFTPTDAAGFIRTQAIRLNAFNHVHKTNPYQ